MTSRNTISRKKPSRWTQARIVKATVNKIISSVKNSTHTEVGMVGLDTITLTQSQIEQETEEESFPSFLVQPFSYKNDETLSDNIFCVPKPTDVAVASVSQNTPSDSESHNSEYLFIKNWALKHNITHMALSELFKWFATKPNIVNFPLDSRTFLKTPRMKLIRSMGSGEFFYFGILNGVLKKLKGSVGEHEVNNVSLVYLDFNIDGLPLHKSVKRDFWPILAKISNFPFMSPFPVAIFCGCQTKPPLKEFFEEFLVEFEELTMHGFMWNNKQIAIKCRSFICDTPARCYIKNVKAHNSYHGCDKCLVEGTYILEKKSMCFLNQNAQLRSDSSFARCEYLSSHQKGNTPLMSLKVGLVSQFPNDYMHSVCLGVVKKLLLEFKNGSRLHRISHAKFNILEQRIQSCKQFWPSEFNRKLRSFSELERWKAKEFRQFLLYFAPLLKDILPSNIYCNLMLLMFAIRVLLNESLNSKYNKIADQWLRLFMIHGARIYGNEFCVYNVHSLIHLAQEAAAYGSLNEINCFPFENYLFFMKKMLRKSNNCLQQVVNRCLEGRELISKKPNFGVILGKQIYFDANRSYLKHIEYKCVRFSKSKGDNAAFLNNASIIKIMSIYVENSNIYLTGVEFVTITNFINYPHNSSILNIYEVKHGVQEITISVDDILCKAVILPFKDNIFCCLPLLHHFD